MVGPSQSGKSTVAMRITMSAAAPRVIVDPQDSKITSVPGAVTFSDPRRIPVAGTVRFCPRDPFDMDAYEALFTTIWATLFPCWVHVDEAGIVTPSVGQPNRNGRKLLVAGAKRQIGLVGAHTRAKELDTNWFGQSAVMLSFPLPREDDRKVMAGAMGVPVDLLEGAYAQCGPREFVLRVQDPRDQTLTIMPAVDPLPWMV